MVIIVGSRREGNCYNLANYVKDKLDKDRIFSKIIVPGNQKIHVCTGCMDCDCDGKCDFNDDMASNIELLKSDNTIMFITPTRWNLLSGDLKIFMDRLNPMYSRQELKNKQAICVAIGPESKSLYSTESALNNLISFVESAKMKCILDKQFFDCFDPKDIFNDMNYLDSFCEEIKKK